MEQDVPRAALAVMEVEKILAASFGEVRISKHFYISDHSSIKFISFFPSSTAKSTLLI